MKGYTTGDTYIKSTVLYSVKSRMVKSNQTVMTQIKNCLAVADNHIETFPKALVILRTIEQDKINLDELCRCQGSATYYHNKYLLDSFYLFLGECYDFAVEDQTDFALAKKYYISSNQPPAKWRLSKMYLDKKIRYDGDIDVICGRLITEAISALIAQPDDPNYFAKRLEYLADMYQGGTKFPPNPPSGYSSVYFEILQWIVDHQQHVQSEHKRFIVRLCEYDVPSNSLHEQELVDQVYQLM